MTIFVACTSFLMIGAAVISFLASRVVFQKEVTQLQTRLEVLEENHLRLEMEYGNLEAYSKHLKDENSRLTSAVNDIQANQNPNNIELKKKSDS